MIPYGILIYDRLSGIPRNVCDGLWCSILVKPKWEFSMSSILKVWYQGGHHREYQVA